MTRKPPTKAKPTPRVLEGIPGTVEPGYREQPIMELPLPPAMLELFDSMHLDRTTLRRFQMGPCNIMVGREPAGANGELLWHLTISTPSRHPNWDEIKTARYRLLPLDICFAMLLPPPDQYVNVPEQDHVMQLWEVRDAREPWKLS